MSGRQRVTGSSPVSSTSLRLERSDKRRLTRRNPDLSGRRRSYYYINRSKTRSGQAIMNTFYFVYILKSLKYPDKHYIGFTTNLDQRLMKHNEGGCPHTIKFRPWIIQSYTAFTSREKALTFEKYLKSGSGREFSKRHF